MRCRHEFAHQPQSSSRLPAVRFLILRASRPGPAAACHGKVPPFVLTDEGDVPFISHYLHGKVWIVTFIFTRCRST